MNKTKTEIIKRQNLSENKHSKLPWERSIVYPDNHAFIYDNLGAKVCMVIGGVANADLIVKAVNSHDKLVEALDFFFKALKDQFLVRSVIDDGDSDWTLKMIPFIRDLQNAERSLADAKGE